MSTGSIKTGGKFSRERHILRLDTPEEHAENADTVSRSGSSCSYNTDIMLVIRDLDDCTRSGTYQDPKPL